MAVSPGRALLVVHIISGLGHGGAETVLHRLLTAPTQRHTHVVISMGDEGIFGPLLKQAGVTVHALHMKGPVGMLRGLWRLGRLLRRLRPDVVQTWMYHADLVGGLIARMVGIRAVSWGIRNSGADLALSSRSSRLCAAICAPLSRFVPAVITACAENAARRHQRWGYDGDRLLVIPNGYDLSRWQPDAGQRTLVRAEWGVDDANAVIGCVARWNALKDHENLIAALGRLGSDQNSWKAVLIGEGLTAANGELMALLRQHDIVERVILMGRRDDVPRLMQGLDIHVLSSRAEGFPNVVAEAMAAGVACVVTDVGDAAAIVGDTGLVVPPRDSAALARAIGRTLSDLGSEAWRQSTDQARLRVQERFSLEAMVNRWDLVWTRLAQDYPKVAKAAYAFNASNASSRTDASSSSDASDTSVPFSMPSTRSVRRLLLVVNNPAFFLSHRLPLARAAREAGYDVHIATMDGPTVSEVRSYGFTHHVIPLSRSGSNPFVEAHSVYGLWRLFRQLRPDVVHAVTIKPVLYGGIAARLAGVPAYVAAISGLGYVFTRHRRGFDYLRMAATVLYRIALAHRNSRVIFQNDADRETLTRLGVVRAAQSVIVRGSGVDVQEFRVVPEPATGPKTVLCVARLLKDKGIYEFVDAARISQGRHPALRWRLAGSPDPGNPASVMLAEVRQWHDEGVIEWVGERQDVPQLYQQAHIAVLASYREGMPKSLIEAAASGRAIVTTDVPGCRDTIQPGVSGLLVPPQDAAALATAVHTLAADDERRHAMGNAGRQLAEREFEVSRIVAQQLAVYESLLNATLA